MEALVSQSENMDQIEVIVRGSEDKNRECFFFLEEILSVIDQVLLEMSPGLPMDKHILSSIDLKRGVPTEKAAIWSPKETMAAMYKGGWSQVCIIRQSNEIFATQY